MSDLSTDNDLQQLRHDHHGCRLCVAQRADAADEIERLRAEREKWKRTALKMAGAAGRDRRGRDTKASS